MSQYFFAITPPPTVLARIEALRARWGNPHHKVEPHATVKVPFAWPGEPAAFLTPVAAACAGMAPFQVRIGAPARFAYAGVLYLSVHSEGLPGLHRAVMAALAGLVPPDTRGHEGGGYSPHVTLAVARFGIDSAGLDAMEWEARTELSDLPAFTVTALRCYHRAADGEPWAPLQDLPLGFRADLL